MTEVIQDYKNHNIAASRGETYDFRDPFAGTKQRRSETLTLSSALKTAGVTVMQALSYVGGELVAAVSGTSEAYYIAAITLPAGTTRASAPVFTEGEFTLSEIIYDASYNTELKKADAFRVSNNNIIVKDYTTSYV